ncbi:hypothetical protein STPH1_3413 [Streptomyces sp. OM5714]|nr:hypothetical protein STPH1_3413 [Streptomyces sp. OM5714]
MIAKRGEHHGTGLGTFPYVVERTIAWLHGFRRLCIRWERRDDIHEAFLEDGIPLDEIAAHCPGRTAEAAREAVSFALYEDSYSPGPRAA